MPDSGRGQTATHIVVAGSKLGAWLSRSAQRANTIDGGCNQPCIDGPVHV